MHFVDHTFETAEHNLAFDEALLDLCEDARLGEVLRFWESTQHFIVLGYSNKIKAEVNLDACHDRSVPVLRRPSGGGTVLQGPGCLNYSLILNISSDKALRNLEQTNCFILDRHKQALQALLDHQESALRIKVQGISDLTLSANTEIKTLETKKFSGNAQRRRKNCLLFHGTFLIDFDLPLITDLLHLPNLRPEYRNDRPHADFLTQIPLTREEIKQGLKKAWDAKNELKDLPIAEIEKLVSEKYSQTAWNQKF